MTHHRHTDRLAPIPPILHRIPSPKAARAFLARTPIAVFLTFALFVPLVAAPAAATQTGTPRPGSGPGSGPGYGELPESESSDGSYGYIRALEGSATLIQGDTGDRDPAQVNQPILAGDRIWVAPRGRVEVVLSDHNLLRIDGDSEVAFDALAGSPDRRDPLTILRLLQGNVQLVVVDDFLGEGLPRIDTPNATVYAYDVGRFRITADGDDWTEVVAREGSAEVVTPDGSILIRRDEEAIVEGERRPVHRIQSAGRLDSLELWGERLDREARYADVSYVDESIRYEAASLDRYGSWVSIEGRYAWRPRVSSDWRPYWNGRWSHSPLGYTWVSYEPWGWVPYHYGTWDYVPGYGWAWFPGSHFAPAWVYWYWTDAYVGWVPVGYYTRYYHGHAGVDFGFRFGVHGWVGGHWSHYHRWNFCDLRYFGRGLQHHHVYRGDRFPRHAGHAKPRRGILTTDTRGLSRDVLTQPDRVRDVLAARTRPAAGDLPDVTPFVAREPEISPDVRRRILVDRGSEDGRKTPTLAVDDPPRARPRGRLPDRGDDAGSGGVRSITRSLPGTPTPGTRAETPGRSGASERGAFRRDDRPRSAGPSDRSVPEVRRPSTPTRDASGADRSWREREPVLPRTPSTRDPSSADRSERRIDLRRSPRSRRDGGDLRERLERLDRDRGGDRTPVPRRVIERVRELRERGGSSSERSGSSTRSRSGSPPPRTRGSSVGSRSSDRRGSSVSGRSSSGRSSTRSSTRSPTRSRGSSVSSRSSSSRSRGSAGRSSRGSSGGNGGAKSRGRGKPPQ